MNKKTFAPLTVLILALAWIFAARAEAQLRPSSAVLLPYFEVDLGGSGKTTMFAVGNILSQPVDVVIEVRTNWGIVVSSIPLKLAAHEVKSFNLRDWIVQGKLPNKVLKQAEKAQFKAVLSGQAAPADKLFYSTAVAPNLAVGSIVIKAQGVLSSGPLWGDFLLVDSTNDVSKGDDLVNLDKATTCPGSSLCLHHALRYLTGAAIDADTMVILWTDRSVQPSKNPYPESKKVAVDGIAYNEAGQQIGSVDLRLLPLQVVSVESLKLLEPFGWLDLQSEEPTFIGIHFDSGNRDGAALQAYCLKDVPPPPPGKGPKIDIHKRTNDQDAELAPGPKIAVGSPVRWDYIVTNSGDVRLTNVTVDDDQGVHVTCPKTALDPGESMTCSGSGTAVACQYANIGTATGKPPSGSDVTASDASHYFGSQNPKIAIKTAVNGQDADTAPGPTITAGSAVSWTYAVTNTGDINLTEVKVTDSKGVAVSCPKTSLRPGESMTCTASGTAVSGNYENIGSVAAKSPCDETVQASDPSHYTNLPDLPKVEITIKKYTNGDDADAAPGPSIEVGKPVAWTYTVKNTGGTVLNNVKVTDNKGVAVSCPKTSLAIGETMTCTGNGTATAGQYENIGTAVGTPPTGSNVTASDPSHYFGCAVQPPPCGIKIKKYTNGDDADSAPGPKITVGDPVHWTYVVTNMGGVAISNIVVTDNRGVAVTCPKTSLNPGEAMTCTGNGTATAGQYENIGTVVGKPPSGPNVTASDPSHYYGQIPPPPPGGQGCTPGYWKNHTDSWPPTGYSPSQKVQSVFSQASNFSTLGNSSLLDALSFQGGDTLQGGAEILLRAGVSALLNAAHSNVSYPRTTASVISDVNSALASGNRDTMISLAAKLDADNNLGCPLN
jgi:hypothetical protein